jgi:hypothetical protein
MPNIYLNLLNKKGHKKNPMIDINAVMPKTLTKDGTPAGSNQHLSGSVETALLLVDV